MYFDTIRTEDIFRYCVNGNALLIDLRDNEKYCAGHIPGAFNIPYEELQERMQEVEAMIRNRSGGRVPVIVYCDRGNTSILASRDFYREGILVKNVYGGMNRYHGPLVRGSLPN